MARAVFHSFGQAFLVDLRQATHTRLPLFLHEISCQKACLAQCGGKRRGIITTTVGSAGKLRQLTVNGPSVPDSVSHTAYQEAIAKPDHRVPNSIPTRLAASTASSFPKIQPHLICGANGTAFSLSLACAKSLNRPRRSTACCVIVAFARNRADRAGPATWRSAEIDQPPTNLDLSSTTS